MQIKDLVGPIAAGTISAAASVMILTARLDERSLSADKSQSEIKTLVNKVSDKQDELSTRVARIEGGLATAKERK